MKSPLNRLEESAEKVLEYARKKPIQLFKPKYNTEKILENLRGVLNSGWTGTGPKCKEFEEKFNEYTGAKHSHYVSSATAALHIATRLLDLKKGSKILTTPLTFVSSNAAIVYEGHEPVFVDVNKHDLSMCALDFMNKLESEKAKAAIWVHYGGHVSDDFEAVMHQRPEKFQIIEDCAHAMGGKYSDGRTVGNSSNMCCHSFQAVKNLATADSGMITVPTEELLKRVKKLAWLGIDKDTFARTNANPSEIYKWKYDVSELGWKYNGNDIMATIALVQLAELDRENAYRRQIAYWYREKLGVRGINRIKFVHSCFEAAHHLFVIRAKNRDEVLAKLKEEKIAPGVHYLPNYEFPVFNKFYRKGMCPNAEQLSAEILSLPNHLELTEKDIDRVCKVVLDVAE